MASGPESDLCSEETFTEQFPVHRACRDGDVASLLSLLQRLSDHGHLSTEDSRYGWTPLHWAAHYGQLECVILLVQMGCAVNTASSRFDQTPTHIAAFGGHSHCVVWLTQAGADVNRQDLTGEAPIHKAARTAGRLASVRNARGQTAADLAQAQGFLDCFHFISNVHLLQLRGLHSAPCCQSQVGRKRLLTGNELSQKKRARVDELQQTGAENMEMMNMDCVLLSDYGETHQSHQSPDSVNKPKTTVLPPIANPEEVDRCGSLHLSGSPGSCASQQPAPWSVLGPDGAELLYGHYHGFGDTAEELTVFTQTNHSTLQHHHTT